MGGDISPGGPEPADGIRASDEDRERLVAELREHAVAGRLTTDELEQRLQDAYAARTTAALDGLRRDLPAPQGDAKTDLSTRRRQLRRRMIQETGGILSLFVVGNVVWLAAGAQGQYWPVWILVVVLIAVVRSGWALYGPAPDLDQLEQELDARQARRHQRDVRRLDRDDREARDERRRQRRLGP